MLSLFMKEAVKRHAKFHHPPLGFPAEPKPNPRIANPFTICRLPCAKTVKISILPGKKVVSVGLAHVCH